MKLVHNRYEAVFSYEESSSIEWIIESPMIYREIIQEILIQLGGKEGNFILSEQDQILPIHKNIDMIINLFAIDVNQKKLLNRLYTEIKEISCGENFYLETQEMLSYIKKYFYSIEQDLSYNIHIDEEIDITQVMKSVGIGIETDAVSLVERLCEYIKLSTRLLNIKMFVLCNTRSFLTEEEIGQLCQMASYEECYLLFLENTEGTSQSIGKRYIIDKDGCEIFE